MGQQINRLNITYFQISLYKNFERLPHSPRSVVRSIVSRDVWCVTHDVIVRYGAELCARGRLSTGMLNCNFMLPNLCVLLQKWMKSVELVLSCIFQTILSAFCLWETAVDFELGRVSVCISAYFITVLLLIQLMLPLRFDVHLPGGASRFRHFLCESCRNFCAFFHSCISAYFKTVHAAYSVNASFSSLFIRQGAPLDFGVFAVFFLSF